MSKVRKRWIYHETEQPKIINAHEYDSYNDDGWEDSPAKFINLKDFEIDADDPIAVQQLGDTVQGVTDALNGALNVDKMTKDALEEYAEEHFGEKLDMSMKIKDLREAVQAMIDGQTDKVAH